MASLLALEIRGIPLLMNFIPTSHITKHYNDFDHHSKKMEQPWDVACSFLCRPVFFTACTGFDTSVLFTYARSTNKSHATHLSSWLCRRYLFSSVVVAGWEGELYMEAMDCLVANSCRRTHFKCFVYWLSRLLSVAWRDLKWFVSSLAALSGPAETRQKYSRENMNICFSLLHLFQSITA
jgi:hypothetical protein